MADEQHLQTSSVASNPDQGQHASFFRHGSWLMMTSVAGGVFSLGVHFLSKKVDVADWGVFLALLGVLMCIPALPLQMVFAQQTAAALATGRDRQLRGMIRLAWGGTLAICLLAGLGLLFGQGALLAKWKMTSAVPLWLALAAALFTFWMPMFLGIMQGQQNFVWFGWGMISSGAGRLLIGALIVFLITNSAAGMMAAVLAGLAAATAIGVWQTRKLWIGPSAPYHRGDLLRQVIPLMLGFGAGQFLFSGDMIFVKGFFSKDEATFYGTAGVLSRALVWFVGPLTAVMFPKIVHSTARAEKSSLMALTLACTAVLATVGALGLWIGGPIAVRIVYTPEYVAAVPPLIPWYAGAMLPYCLANVLLNNLMAKSDFRPVPWVVLVAIGYGVTLQYVHDTPVIVLQMVGLFNLVLLGVCALFTWGLTAKAK